MTGSRAVALFGALDLILAAVWLAFVLMLLALLVMSLGALNGSFPSPDPPKDLLTGAFSACGMLALYVPGLIALTGAGIGLLRRAAWGFYWHLAAALLVAVSCFGIVYTAVALAFALRPEFRATLVAKRKTLASDLH
jgi:hypothetical protein